MRKNQFPLADKAIGISISESPDMEILGYSQIHLSDALTEFARYMLVAGATIAYGGDLRAGGFTFTLFDLVSTYKGVGGREANRIRNYLGWPIHLFLDGRKKAQIKTSAEIIELPAPEIEGLDPDKAPDLKNGSVEEISAGYYAWCLSMSGMRRRLAEDNHAQVLMGGRTFGYKGKYPGLVEEAYECMKAEVPVFLIGAFGGCTGVIIDALRGNQPDRLTEKLQFEKSEDYKNLVEYYNKTVPEPEEKIDYQKLVSFFNEKGIAGLNNNLTIEENERLFTSPHLPEIIFLVLKGLKAISS